MKLARQALVATSWLDERSMSTTGASFMNACNIGVATNLEYTREFYEPGKLGQ